VTSEMRHTE